LTVQLAAAIRLNRNRSPACHGILTTVVLFEDARDPTMAVVPSYIETLVSKLLEFARLQPPDHDLRGWPGRGPRLLPGITPGDRCGWARDRESFLQARSPGWSCIRMPNWSPRWHAPRSRSSGSPGCGLGASGGPGFSLSTATLRLLAKRGISLRCIDIP